MIAELKLLGYRKVSHPRQIGEFAASSTKIDLWRRPFFHPKGEQAAQRVMIHFDGQGVDSVRCLPDNKEIAVFHLIRTCKCHGGFAFVYGQCKSESRM